MVEVREVASLCKTMRRWPVPGSVRALSAEPDQGSARSSRRHVSNNGQTIPVGARRSLLAQNDWADNLQRVPAPVINYGIFNHLPYISFRCAGGGSVSTSTATECAGGHPGRSHDL